MGAIERGKQGVIRFILVVGDVGCRGGGKTFQQVGRGIGGCLERNECDLIVPQAQPGGKLVAADLDDVDRNSQRLLPALLEQTAQLRDLAVGGDQQLNLAQGIRLQLIHAGAVSGVGLLRVIEVVGGDRGLVDVRLGEQRDGRRNQAVIDTQVFLPAVLQKGFQCAAVDGAQKALADLLIGKGGVVLIKDQRPDGALGGLAAHPCLHGKLVLLIVCLAAVRFTVHQQLEGGGRLFAPLLLCGGLDVAVDIEVNARGEHLLGSIILVVFLEIDAAGVVPLHQKKRTVGVGLLDGGAVFSVGAFKQFLVAGHGGGMGKSFQKSRVGIVQRKADGVVVERLHTQRRSIQLTAEYLLTVFDGRKHRSKGRGVDAVKDALKSKDKVKIKAAADSLQIAADKYFASVPFPEVERLVGKKMLQTYMKYIPAEQRIGIFKIIDRRFKGDSDAFIDACFEYSIFGSKENFAKFIRKPSLYKIGNDWMTLFKYSITDGLLQTTIAMMDANRNYNAAHKVWVKGMMDMKREAGTPIYPDANSTLRLTYGRVLPYRPADGVEYGYYTTLKGAMEKEDPNNWEFVVPARLKQLYQAKDFGQYAMPDGEMPVCFIVNTDNTGGNSGSPVFNAKGELIGTAFDRNYEGLTGDIAFRPSSQRAACVDIRYTLFIIDKYAGASHIIKELTISD